MRRKSVVDPDLGELVRRRGWWRGHIEIGDDPAVPLAILGSRGDPDPHAVTMARSISASYAGWQPALAEMLAEHHPETISVDSVVVPAPIYAALITLDGELTIELGYHVDWDEEHTLGARFRGSDPVELCGSVLEP